MTPQELRAARESAGLTPTQLAFALGVSERTIYRYESGISKIRKPTATALVQALKKR